jgi:hypothetical protein
VVSHYFSVNARQLTVRIGFFRCDFVGTANHPFLLSVSCTKFAVLECELDRGC